MAVAAPSAVAAPLDVSIRGTVLSTPCVINNNTNIAVNLGNNLLTSRIPASNSSSTGNTYETEIPYTLDCTTAQASGLQVKMQMVGTGASFDNRVLMSGQHNTLNSYARLIAIGATVSAGTVIATTDFTLEFPVNGALT
ncbi:hypothetical protein ACMV5I_27405 [Serratia sp. T13T92]|uniref:hypothetical protein n=1 Tax=Serratia sp. T13T92 TaxID=3397496 RepID=UPI0039E1854E